MMHPNVWPIFIAFEQFVSETMNRSLLSEAAFVSPMLMMSSKLARSFSKIRCNIEKSESVEPRGVRSCLGKEVISRDTYRRPHRGPFLP